MEKQYNFSLVSDYTEIAVLAKAINCWEDVNGLDDREMVLRECREHLFRTRTLKDLFTFLQRQWLEDPARTIEQLTSKAMDEGLLDIFLDTTNCPLSSTPLSEHIKQLKKGYWEYERALAMESGNSEKFRECEREIDKVNMAQVGSAYSKETMEEELRLGAEKGVDLEIYSTHIAGLDEYYKMVKKQTTVLTGIPGSGKSNFADEIAVNMAWKHNWKTVMFSPENQPIRLHLNDISRKWEGQQTLGTGKKVDTKWVADHFDLINTNEMEHDIDQILQTALRYEPDLFILDPWNEVMVTKDSETLFISECLSKIKSFSYRADCHVIIVAHPTKLRIAEKGDYKGMYPPVNAYDISGSAAWYSKPDNILSLWRDKKTSKVEVHIQKIKFEMVTGMRGQHDLQFVRDTGGYIE